MADIEAATAEETGEGDAEEGDGEKYHSISEFESLKNIKISIFLSPISLST